jgi:hypothetical protein
MVSNWKTLKLISCLLFVSATAANAQVRSAIAESVVSKGIGPAGGFIEIPGRVRVAFPARFFATPETFSVRISGDPTTDAARAGYEIHGAGRSPYLPFDVLVEASQKPQAAYEVTIILPSEYLRQLPSTLKPTAFREVLHGSTSELHYSYEEVPAELEDNSRRLRVKVPKLEYYRLEQLYDTIVVGCVPR